MRVVNGIGRQFQKADELLKDVIDKLGAQFRFGAPSFFSDYQNARVIIGRGRTQRPASAHAGLSSA